MQAISSVALPLAATPKRGNIIDIYLSKNTEGMPYRSLVFPEYGMTNASNFKCEFANNSKPKISMKRGNRIYIYLLESCLG